MHPTSSSEPGIVVVGGGITGLSAAYRAATTLPPSLVLLLEAAPVLGGKIVTECVEGCLVEGGPDCFLGAKPAAVELCRELGIADRLVPVREEARRTYIRHGSRLLPLPDGLTGLVPGRLGPLLTTPLLSPLARMRVALEPFVVARRDESEESVAGFARRRLGTQAYARLIEPLLAGVFAGDGEQLSLDAAFPHLRDAERRHGSLLRAMRHQRRATHSTAGRSAHATRGFLAPLGGMRELVEAVARQVPADRIWTGARVTRLCRETHGWRLELADGRTAAARCVILAIPAFAAADLLDEHDSALAQTLREIPFVSTVTATVAFDTACVPALPRGSGYVSPRSEVGEVVACTWSSQKFAARAPDHLVLLRFFIGRSGRETLATAADHAILAAVSREAHAVLGIRAAPRFARIFRWPRGLPQYTLGHRQRLQRIIQALDALPGLHLAGASYRGLGLPDCIASGQAAAARALARFHVSDSSSGATNAAP